MTKLLRMLSRNIISNVLEVQNKINNFIFLKKNKNKLIFFFFSNEINLFSSKIIFIIVFHKIDQ